MNYTRIEHLRHVHAAEVLCRLLDLSSSCCFFVFAAVICFFFNIDLHQTRIVGAGIQGILRDGKMCACTRYHRLMRLTTSQTQLITEGIHRHFGAQARVRLFGVRTNDFKRSGDVNLYVEADRSGFVHEPRCKIQTGRGLRPACFAMMFTDWVNVIMARKSERAALVLSEESRAKLGELAASRTSAIREVERAGVLLKYVEELSISEIQRQLGASQPMIHRCIDKALAAGVQPGLKDAYHRPHEPEISEEGKAWVVSFFCVKLKDLGLTAELWSLAVLARDVAEYAEETGFSRLRRAGKSTVWRILDEHDLNPHKIRYYLERRDPDFDRKIHEMLMVYREVSCCTEGVVHDGRPNPIYTVNVDERPGGARHWPCRPPLPPIPGKAPNVGREYEYVCHGTASILAGIDLNSRHVFSNVEDRHSMLNTMDDYYPPEVIIRVVLDNHSAHISPETMAYIATHSGRFEYVHTPKHRSWLSRIECTFSRMARTFLRHIRVSSINDLKERILKGIAEMNETPVVFRWKKFDLNVV